MVDMDSPLPPAEVQPVELLDRLGDQAEIHAIWRLKMLLPPRFGSRHLLGQVFRLPVSHAVLFTAGMLVPSPGYLRTRYPKHRHPYLKWWSSLHENFSQEALS